MLRIYSDEILEQRLRAKRSQMLLVFFAGVLAGLALTGIGLPEASAQVRPAKPAPAQVSHASCMHQRATQSTDCADNALPRLAARN